MANKKSKTKNKNKNNKINKTNFSSLTKYNSFNKSKKSIKQRHLKKFNTKKPKENHNLINNINVIKTIHEKTLGDISFWNESNKNFSESKTDIIDDKKSNNSNLKSQNSTNLTTESNSNFIKNSIKLKRLANANLDLWQQKALKELLNKNHVIIDAPTSAGKTRVVEVYLIKKIFDQYFFNYTGFRACYTCPIKSLANDKFSEFSNLFGKEHVGISTGDIKINLDAPIIIATLESYRNSLLGVDHPLKVDLIIFDEYHYIADYSRGNAWQEAIILSQKSSQFIFLSASLSNASEFVPWIKHIHHNNTKLIQETHRPVQLKNLIFTNNNWYLDEHIKSYLDKYEKNLVINPKKHYKTNIKRTVSSIIKACDLGLTPIIVYCGKRFSCEKLTIQICNSSKQLNDNDQEQISQKLDKILQKIPCKDLFPKNLLNSIYHYGICYHHSGLSPSVKMCIESLLKSGSLKICMATSGLSMGINFAVKSTMIADYARPGDKGFSSYSPGEVMQMSGRAGRRGIDIVGYTLWITAQMYITMSKGKRKPIKPTLYAQPSTFLGLIAKTKDLKVIETLFSKSFNNYYDKLNKKESKNTQLFSKDTLDNLFSDQAKKLKCYDNSPTYNYINFLHGKKKLSYCFKCPKLSTCHGHIDSHKFSNNHLFDLHCHLHNINALDNMDNLSQFGKIAMHLPHGGGLYIAYYINDIINSHNNKCKKIIKFNKKEKNQKMQKPRPSLEFNMIELIKIISCLSIAYYKPIYKFYTIDDINSNNPIKYNDISLKLKFLYPQSLFVHLYEKTSSKYSDDLKEIFIEYNSNAGEILQTWCDPSVSWQKLCNMYCNKYLAEGDLFSLINKVVNYLKSLAKADIDKLSELAKDYISLILRDPIDFLDYAIQD